MGVLFFSKSFNWPLFYWIFFKCRLSFKYFQKNVKINGRLVFAMWAFCSCINSISQTFLLCLKKCALLMSVLLTMQKPLGKKWKVCGKKWIHREDLDREGFHLIGIPIIRLPSLQLFISLFLWVPRYLLYTSIDTWKTGTCEHVIKWKLLNLCCS